MRFSIVAKLCFYLLLSERVSSTQNSFLKNQTRIKNENEDILEKFLIELKRAYIPRLKLRHITMVGALALHRVEPLFESLHPCIICSELIECKYQEHLSRGNLVIIFIDDLREKTFRKNIELLTRCRKCSVIFISDQVSEVEDIWSIFILAMKHNVPYAEFAHVDRNGVQFYSNFFTTNCSVEVKLIVDWRPGINLKNTPSWAFRLRNLNGCPVSVSSATFLPQMTIEENRNGSLTIAGGRDGELLLTLASKLNFTVNLRTPPIADQLNYSRRIAILNEVARGICEFGIGRLRPTTKLDEFVRHSLPYDEECVTWGVPRVMNWSSDIVWVEFSWEVWLSVGLIFSMGCAIGYVHRNIVISKNDKQTRLGCGTIILNGVAIHLGNAFGYASSSTRSRLVVMAYLYYAMVITTAYKASLASILTTYEDVPNIRDAQGIIEANLNVGGSLNDYTILKDQENESKHSSKLLERFFVENNVTKNWERLRFDQDYAFLSRRSFLDYKRRSIIEAHEAVTFNVFDSCVLTYHTVIAFQKKSVLRKPVDDVIVSLTESGILKHWDIDEFNTDQTMNHKDGEEYSKKPTAYKFRHIFILYSIGVTFCLVTFLTELLVQKLRST